MKVRHAASVCALVVAAAAGPGHALTEVDPYWLRSWNEAEMSRPRTMTSSARIAPADEPGAPLVVHAQVVEPDGRTPAVGVVVHAYHRDREGFDFGPNDDTFATWRLQGWVRTDAEGRFEFETIRPGADHLGREGAHIHFTLESRDFGRQWAPTVFFSDDPLVTERQRQQSAAAGEFGAVREVDAVDGVQHVAVKIRLATRGQF